MTREMKPMMVVVVVVVGRRRRIFIGVALPVIPDWRVSILLNFLVQNFISLLVLYLIKAGAMVFA